MRHEHLQSDDAGLELARLHRELAILRREYEDTQLKMRAAEDLLFNLGRPHSIKLAEWAPEDQYITLGQGQSVTQQLPFSARGFLSVDLWMPHHKTGSSELPQVSLTTISNKTFPLVPFASLQRHESAGWTSFFLPEALDLAHQDIRLEISNTSRDNVTLGCGFRSPVRKYWPRFVDRRSDRVLALRAWSGVVGTQSPERIGTEASDKTLGWRRYFKFSDLNHPKLFSLPDHQDDYVATQYWEAEDAVLVHPSRAGVVVAVVQDVPAEGLQKLSAIVNVGHEQAPQIAFSCAAVPSGTVIHKHGIHSMFKSWTSIPAMGWGQVHAFVEDATDADVDLYFATALTKPMDNTNSWALFRGLVLEGV